MIKVNVQSQLISLQDELLRFAYKLTSNYDDANDLLQETSHKVLSNVEKYQEDTNFKAWVFTVMRNIFINNYRKAIREQTFVNRTENQFFLSGSPFEDGNESTEHAYDLKEINLAVRNLPKEYRIPFAMHVSGFKYCEIADKLGLPLGTVKSRIFFTHQKLQKELRDFR